MISTETPRLVFVVGASRSGTTMLSRILDKQPRISTLNELHYFGDLWSFEQRNVPLTHNQAVHFASILLCRHSRGIWDKGPSPAEQNRAQKFISECSSTPITGISLFTKFIRMLSQELNSEIICEQTPRNIFYASDLLKAFPGARVVQIVRDPRAVLASQKNRWKRRKRLGAQNIPWIEVIRERVNYHPLTTPWLWRKAVTAGLALKGLDKFYMLRFEDLAANPEKEMQKLCEFLQVEYSPSLLDIPQIDSSSRFNDSTARGISREAVESWRKHLRHDEILACEAVNEELMKEMGYSLERPRGGKSKRMFQYLTFPFHVFCIFLVNPRRALIQARAFIRSS